MNLKEDLLRGIYSYGFEKPSAIQQRAIKPLLMMRDTIAQAQSGTGKTATFSIGAALRRSSRARDWGVAHVLCATPWGLWVVAFAWRSREPTAELRLI